MGRKRRLKAADFGDDPSIRRKYGEAANVNLSEPWEVEYAERKVAYKGDTWEILKIKGSKAKIRNSQGKKKWVELSKLTKI